MGAPVHIESKHPTFSDRYVGFQNTINPYEIEKTELSNKV